MLILAGCQNIAIEPSLVSVPECGYGWLACFCAFPDRIYSRGQATVFRLVDPEKSRERAALCFLAFIYMFF